MGGLRDAREEKWAEVRKGGMRQALMPSVVWTDRSCCGIMCWPSVDVVGAFCHGMTHRLPDHGLVTDIGGSCSIKEIDGQPALEVRADAETGKAEWSGVDHRVG